MRVSPLLIVCLAGSAALTIAGGASAQAFPSRRAGLWETTMAVAGPQGRTMTMRMCADPAREHGLAAFSGPMGGGAAAEAGCSKREVHAIAGGYAFNTVCARGGTTIQTSGTITGDFQSHYQLEATTRGAGPERHVSMQARWIGPCAPGAQNSIVLPDGRVIQIPGH